MTSNNVNYSKLIIVKILLFLLFTLYLFACSPIAPTEIDIAYSLNKQGNLYSDQGRYAEAESLYKRSLAIREKAFGPEHPLVATSLNNLASLYRNQGRFEEALVASRSSTDIYLKRFSQGFGEAKKGLRIEQSTISSGL